MKVLYEKIFINKSEKDVWLIYGFKNGSIKNNRREYIFLYYEMILEY